MPKGQKLVIAGGLTIAFLALGLAAVYSNTTPQGVTINSGDSNGGPDALGGGLTPVEGFFPRTGQAGACSEPVGVDLIDGYGATLVINGVPIAPEEMNVYAAPADEVSDDASGDDATTANTVFSAGGSLGQFTWGPEADCPQGAILRPRDNLLIACVYRLTDDPTNCLPYRYQFNLL